MGKYKKNLTDHGQVLDSVGTIWVLHPTDHYDNKNPQ
jgi:hypothetical protein